MPFGAALSEHPIPAVAAGEVLGQLLEQVGTQPDLAVVFATVPLTGAMEDIVGTIRSVLQPKVLVGSTAVSVLARCQEVETTTALSMWAGSVGPVRATRLTGGHLDGLPDNLAPGATVLVLADPFTFPADQFLAQLAMERPDVAVVGGLASAARGPGGNRLILDSAMVDSGAVAVVLESGVVSTVVSQGCRPIGNPMIVTRAEGRMIYELAGQPALDRLQQLTANLPDGDRDLLGAGLHLGVVVDETKASFGPGDFVVRNVVGADRNNGAIEVGDEVPPATTVQFHVRDASTADDELRSLLAAEGEASGALIFTCNGRGTNLFGTPHHDADLVAAITNGRCSGMFCAAEIGPIGNRNFLHGFTAAIALFHDRSVAAD